MGEYEIDISIFAAVTSFTGIVYWAVFRQLHTPMQQLFWTAGLAGTWLLAGVGAAYTSTPFWYAQYRGAPPEYACFYCLFIVALGGGFDLAIRLTSRLGARLQGAPAEWFAAITQHPRFIQRILGGYFLLLLFPLLYPTFRLHTLLAPPRPDITFFTGLEEQKGVIERIVEYATILWFPFYLTSLYPFRRRYGLLLLLVFLPSYIGLCDTGYIGRGGIVIALLLILLATWLDNPAKRRGIMLAVSIGTPLCLFFFFVLGHIRAGNDWRDAASSRAQGVQDVVFSQTSFPTLSWAVLESDQRANPKDFIQWLLTTPIPKVFTGRLSETRINYDIAYLIRQLRPGDEGFTVDLTGVVTESVFIYGRRFFWLHAVFLGAVFGILCSLTERIPCALFISTYYIVMWSYVANRAGVASAWPPLCNSFLLFYLLLFHLYTISGKRSQTRGSAMQTA
ncbi:MAG: hypothetical protein GXY83_01800 [Rhodopirellula sp.]|nr:hypothetical protein [Rhodopirellula sp.]